MAVQPSTAAPSSSRVATETVQKAVNALLQWRNTKSQAQKPQLLEQDEFLYLVLTLNKIPPKGRTNAHKIPLPHPLLDDSSSSELCLFIDDRPKPTTLTSEDAKKKIKAEDIPIAKVIKLSKLRSDYRPFEAKRKLCDSYDMFFADKRVIHLLPKLLGKQFFKRKKIPVPVDLTHKNWKEQIERACSSALLYLRTGTCSVVKVGKASMESGEIAENAAAAIDGVVEIVPKKWAGVRSFHLKFSESLALPVYQAVPELKLKIEGTKETTTETGEEGKKDLKLVRSKEVGSKNTKKKKGRIHEVRYMDADLGENEGVLGGEDDDEEEEEEEEIKRGKSENADVGSGKKRKKGDLIGVEVAGKVNGEGRLNKSAAPVEEKEDFGEKKVKRKKGGVEKFRDEASESISSKRLEKILKKSAAPAMETEDFGEKKVKRKKGDVEKLRDEASKSISSKKSKKKLSA